MPTIISGDTGIDKIAAGAIEYADLPAGSVLQVVNTINGTEQYTTSSSNVATSITASITPRFATSKILVIASASCYIDGNSSVAGGWFILRNGSTQVATFNDAVQVSVATTRFALPVTTLTYLDSPATTSATTYTVYMNKRSGTGTVGVNSYGSSPPPSSGFTLMEIAQ